MNNLQKFEKFFERKKWKYKKFNFKGQEKLMLKTYHNSQRCHMFISETHIQFSFYKGYMSRVPGDNKLKIGMKTQFSLTKRYGSLQIFTYMARSKQVRNLAINGPACLLATMNMVINRRVVDGAKSFETKNRMSRKSRNKMFQTLDLFLAVNGFKTKEALTDTNFCETLLGFSYPSMKNFPVKPTKRTSAIFRKPNLGFNTLLKRIFGHKSKLIGKIVSEKKQGGILDDMLDMGFLLRSKLNRGQIEKIITFITNSHNGDIFSPYGRFSIMPSTKSEFLGMRKFIRQFTGEQLTHLFTQSFSGYELQDAARQWAEHPKKIVIPEKVQNWRFVHEEITRQYRKLAQEDYEFDIKPTIKKVDGLTVDSETIVVPKTRHELVDWGTIMNNCIAGYHSQFHTGQTVILGVKEENKLKYNIEIRHGQIVQFMANRNVRADEIVIDKYKKILQNYKLVS